MTATGIGRVSMGGPDPSSHEVAQVAIQSLVLMLEVAD